CVLSLRLLLRGNERCARSAGALEQLFPSVTWEWATMGLWIEQLLIRYPELALFLVIGFGYWIGSLKIGAFSLGPVTGALFAGLLIGQFAHVPPSGMIKPFLFLLFLFGVGYSLGPQLVPSLKQSGFKPIVLVLVVAITGLTAAVIVSKSLQLDAGFAAGLL